MSFIARRLIEINMVAGLTEEWKEMKRKDLLLPKVGKVKEEAPIGLRLATDLDGSIHTNQPLGLNSGDVMP